jgi:hypothetical protein
VDGDLALSKIVDRLRALGGLPEAVARRAVPGIQVAARATAAAGTTPEGQAWPAKKDGGRPLVHAADHVTARAVGAVVQIELTGVPENVHNAGSAKGTKYPKRQIIPGKGDRIPPSVAAALHAAAAAEFAAVTGGR